MKNYSKNIYEIETLGFTIVENVFNSKEVSDLRSHLKTALEDDIKRFSGVSRKNPDLVVDLTIHHPIFLKALDNDIIQNFLSQLLDEGSILYSYTSTILRPVVASAVHNMHVDTNKFIPNYITGIVMTIPLEDFTNENGATLYLPGSQNLSTVPSEETFSKYALSTERKAGDVLFFNPRVFHRAGNNNTSQIRYGLTAYATRSFFKQRFDFPRMIPKESLNGLSDRLINFLGYNARVPESLEQYYLPAEERLYKL